MTRAYKLISFENINIKFKLLNKNKFETHSTKCRRGFIECNRKYVQRERGKKDSETRNNHSPYTNLQRQREKKQNMESKHFHLLMFLLQFRKISHHPADMRRPNRYDKTICAFPWLLFQRNSRYSSVCLQPVQEEVGCTRDPRLFRSLAWLSAILRGRTCSQEWKVMGRGIPPDKYSSIPFLPTFLQ